MAVFLGPALSFIMNPVAARDWLEVTRGSAPLVLAMPHTGTEIPAAIESRLASGWLARKDTDWWVDRLYAFAGALDATIVRTRISRSVIDANRDPGGASLYPGQATTGLCPETTFDGEPLYADGAALSEAEILERRRSWYEPYHAALAGEIERLRTRHGAVVLYDCHSIRSRIPRLFQGELPHFNIGTFEGASCAPALTARIEAACAASGLTRVTNGRFKGGYTTRYYGRPSIGVHAVQMELACRGYLREPDAAGPDNWPPPWDEAYAAPLRATLERILRECLAFLRT